MTERSASSALDEYLVVECQLGNADAFGALVRRWHARLVRRARELTGDPDAALDVVQESWIGIVKGLHGLRDPASFPAWALRIVANKARDAIRREQSRRWMSYEAATESSETQEAVGSSQGLTGDLHRIREGLAELAPAQRTILRRHYLDGVSVAEIAAELDVPPGTVKSRLYNARKELRRRLEED